MIKEAPIGMAISSFSGQLLRANRSFCQMIGYTAEELLKKTNKDITFPDDLLLTDDYMKKLALGETDSFTTEKRYIHKNGEIVWGLITLIFHREKILPDSYYLAQIQDISERKVAEEELRLQSEIITRMAEGGYLIRQDGSIIYTNPEFEKMFGYDSGEMIGQDVKVLAYPSEQDPDETARHIMGEIQQKGAWQGEVQNIKKDGTPFWCHANVSVFDHSKHGQVIVAVHSDITNRKQLEGKLLQANKMQAVGTLAGGIAHEFNNLLSIIMGCADMARDEVPKDSFAGEQLDNVMEALYRVKDLVKQILTFSRRSKQQRASANLCTFVKESAKLIKSSIPTSVEIKSSIASASGNAIVNPTEIQQIVMNFCSNAVWAMEEKGVLTLDLREVHLTTPEELTPTGLSAGRYAKLSFSDTGCGMDQHTLSQIFDPFFTTREVGQGTGMGLSIVYGIMESYGGTITVESEIGSGTTFHLYFPVTDIPAVEDRAQEEEDPRGSERILFVDDEKMYAEMTNSMISRLGYDLDLKLSSREAFEAFQKAPDSYDLVITDQVMPDLSSEKLVHEIRAIRPEMPIILCTGYSTQMDEKKATSLGINAFAFKPIEKKDIAKLIRKVLDEKQ